ncbi:MAG: hypothetical protein LBS37_01540 [Treponema sp.]|jgi:hypothetical protein|nr:hypothetical protein [Treponema sp.]
MFSKEMLALLLQVITSWQVIAVTAAVLIYMSLVSYVAHTHHRPRSISRNRPKKQKAAAAISGPEEVTGAGADTNEELGLEET